MDVSKYVLGDEWQRCGEKRVSASVDEVVLSSPLSRVEQAHVDLLKSGAKS